MERVLRRICLLSATAALLVTVSFSDSSAEKPVLTEEQRARVEKAIEKAKASLGDKLLTTADEVITMHVDAIGGREAIESVRTMMYRGRNIVLLSEERPIERYFSTPDLLRQQRPGGDSYTLSNGEKVYGVSSRGSMEMTQAWVPELKHARIDGNFLDYSERGITYEYLGLHAVYTEPTVFYHLRRDFGDGHVDELYFDVETGLLRMTYVPATESFRAYYDFREAGGMLFPHMWMRLFGEQTPPHLFIIDEVRVNEEYDDSFFAVP